MPGPVSLAFIVNVNDEHADAFGALIEAMVESAREERGLLIYEWSRSSGSGEIHGYERYADSDAVLEHMARFRESFADRFFEMVELASFRVYGDPDGPCRDALTAGGADLLPTIGGFHR